MKKAISEKLEKRTEKTDGPPAEGPQVGIEEIKELIIFVFILAEVTIEVLEDGLGLLDVLEVLKDEELRESFGPAIGGVDEVPEEVADLSWTETKEIADLIWEESWSLWHTISQ